MQSPLNIWYTQRPNDVSETFNVRLQHMKKTSRTFLRAAHETFLHVSMCYSGEQQNNKKPDKLF